MAVTKITRVERHVALTDWGVPHDELQQSLDEARAEYLAMTKAPGNASVPPGAIRAVPANGEIVVVFSIETSK